MIDWQEIKTAGGISGVTILVWDIRSHPHAQLWRIGDDGSGNPAKTEGITHWAEIQPPTFRGGK